jgi:hypothetical protein
MKLDDNHALAKCQKMKGTDADDSVFDTLKYWHQPAGAGPW